MSSEYENVVGGKLRLKGNPLEVKTGGISKKKKKKMQFDYHDSNPIGKNHNGAVEYTKETDKDDDKDEPSEYNNHLTPAERRYLEQWEKIDRQRLTKMASKSHRDRIQEFNQYLANLSEHYDIPKVGPG